MKRTPVFCSVIGAVARGTVFMSNGFSEGSSVYWWSDFSKPGMDTDKPEHRRKRLINQRMKGVAFFIIINCYLNSSLWFGLTVKDVRSI